MPFERSEKAHHDVLFNTQYETDEEWTITEAEKDQQISQSIDEQN